MIKQTTCILAPSIQYFQNWYNQQEVSWNNMLVKYVTDVYKELYGYEDFVKKIIIVDSGYSNLRFSNQVILARIYAEQHNIKIQWLDN